MHFLEITYYLSRNLFKSNCMEIVPIFVNYLINYRHGEQRFGIFFFIGTY